MILKEIKIILSEKVAIEYKDLNRIVFEERKKEVDSSFHQTLLRSIERTRDLLRANPFYGNQISKKLIPKELIKNYEIDNLWRVELPNRWRLLYSIVGDEVKIVCFILGYMDHKKYNKLFIKKYVFIQKIYIMFYFRSD